MTRTAVRLFLFAALVWTAVGCGRSSGAKVTGVLVENGEPLKFGDKERAYLAFVRVQKEKEEKVSLKAHPGADVNLQDATFVFIGPDDGLVSPGEYKVTLRVAPREAPDRFDDAFNADKTPLSYTVTAEPHQEIIIDVGKKTVTRK
jgi:hypothetical protein